jgi:hypothetical protein
MAQGGGQLGIWDLSGSEVRIRTHSETAEALRLFQPSPAESSWPDTPQDVNDPRAWRDPRFLADLGLIVADGRIDPGLLSGAPGRGGLPSAVAARIRLEGGLLEGGLPSQPSYRGERFEFRSSHGVIRQPVTDTMRWTLDSPSAAVVIEIVPVQGGTPRRLLLAASSTPHQAFVSNLPAEARHESGLHGMSEDEMAALHFAAYYKLLKSEPTARPLPRLLSQAETAGTGFNRPATCPPAIFRRE